MEIASPSLLRMMSPDSTAACKRKVRNICRNKNIRRDRETRKQGKKTLGEVGHKNHLNFIRTDKERKRTQGTEEAE